MRFSVIVLPAGSKRRKRYASESAGSIVAPNALSELQLSHSTLAPDIAGPRVYTLKELLQSYLRAGHRHRPIVPLRLPGEAARAVRGGANLAPDHAVGRRTWEEFLAERMSTPGANRDRSGKRINPCFEAKVAVP